MSLEFVVTREQWIETCYNRSGSENTKQMGIDMLKIFDLYNKTLDKTEDEILGELKRIQKEPELYIYLNNFVQFLVSRNLVRNSIDINLSFLKSYLRSHGIRIYSEDAKQFIKLPKRIIELRPALTAKIIKQLVVKADDEMRALLLVLASSGMRISEALQLRVKDIDLKSNPATLKIRAKTTKTRRERQGFISSEAVRHLILSNKEPDDYVFCETYSKSILIVKEQNFDKLRQVCGLLDKYDDDKRYHVNIHAFRSFFHTQATRILGGDIAHALLGHHKYLDQYFRLTPEEQKELYKKLEPHIKILN